MLYKVHTMLGFGFVGRTDLGRIAAGGTIYKDGLIYHGTFSPRKEIAV